MSANTPSEFRLVQLRNGAFSVRSQAYNETMHPGIGPQAEADALYVQQTGLCQRLAGHPGEFVIWDVGLGAAANALTVLDRTTSIPSTVYLLSFDNSDGPLRFASEHPTELPYLAPYEASVRSLLADGRTAFHNGQQAVRWEFRLGDFPALLHSPEAGQWPKPHLILFDPFSPAKNPAMWTLPLFQRLFELLDPGRPCLMPTYSRSTMLRVTLLLAGFHVGAGQATGMKDETTVAANVPELIQAPLDRRWLERALRSDSAEPLRTGAYRKAPLTPGTAEQLRNHPQFR